MFYRVKIEKKRRDSKLDASYHWEVECFKDSHEDTRQDWELRGGGYCYRLESAKKKALKHLMSVEKDVKAGMKFGVIFETNGTAEQVKKSLEQVQYADE